MLIPIGDNLRALHFIFQCTLQPGCQPFARWAAVVGHLGREIPTQLIFYCINESHLDQTVTGVSKLDTVINLDNARSKKCHRVRVKHSGTSRT